MSLLRMPLAICLGAALAAVHMPAAADFPPPGQLPPRPELPDPLVMLDGTRVASREDWESKRKPELQALFQHYMYGKLPPAPEAQGYTVLFADDAAGGGKAKLREIEIRFEKPALTHKMYVLVALPKGVARPPVFVGMNFCGNHTLLEDPRIRLPTVWMRNSCPGVVNERATDQGRGAQRDVWNIDLILERGYGLACFYSGDVDPDTPDMRDGIGPAFYRPGQTEAAADDAATIALWAWGFHRVVDYLLQEAADEIDPQRVIAVGHSRNGKTALLATAFDERIAMAIPLQAGCGGTAPSRTTDTRAESVKRINTSFPHWFCGNFKQFNEQVERLPFDQHCLIALCAPRPVLLPNAEEDLWANPSGQFTLLQAADPVYRLYGEGLAAGARPEMGKLIDSRLGYFIRPGKHSMTRADWQVFLDYADKQLGR